MTTAPFPNAPVSPHNSPVARRFYPEIDVAGFGHRDCTVAFYSQVAALLKPNFRLLDYGAGRGEHIADDPVAYRRHLQNFQGRCAHVSGCDVDPVVMTNPFLDAAAVFEPGKPLPYPDASFDIVVSRYVFEHVADPEEVSRELMRILKPGGWLCVMTPNKWGYVAISARLVPNRFHAKVVSYVQPGRKAEDVFPTFYRLNTPGAFQKWFGKSGSIRSFRFSAEPAYHFGSTVLYGAFELLHRLLPAALQTCICVFVKKA
jgi:SAM-dependent methyltransferase